MHNLASPPPSKVDSVMSFPLIRLPGSMFVIGCVLLIIGLLFASSPLGTAINGSALAVFLLGAFMWRRRIAETADAENISHRPNIEHFDRLTGLSNRHGFNARMRALDDAQPGLTQLGLLLIDLDRFTSVNDNHGHKVGDALLTALSKRFQQKLAEQSIVTGELFRLDSDKFVIACPTVDDSKQLSELAQCLRNAAQEPVHIAGDNIVISSSIGIAWANSQPHSHSELMRAADIAIRHIKRMGKNQFMFYHDIHDISIIELINIEQRLRDATKNSEIVPYYQPIVDLRDGKVVSLEALARWQPADSAFTPPKNWMRYASPSLMTDISQFVLLQAQIDAMRLGAMGLTDLQININITESMLFREEFRLILEEICREAHDMPQIAVELTETIFVDRSFDTIKHYLERIRAAGSKIYLDDFGTGFASLNHLRDLSVDAIKIDKEFIIHLDQPENQAIVQAMIALATSLEKHLICEGLETEENRRTLMEMGCHYGQGYLYSPAIPLDELLPMLEHKRPHLSLQAL